MPSSLRLAPAALALCASVWSSGEARPLRLEDTVEFAGIDELRVSPDGGTVAISVLRMVPGENRFSTDLFVVPADGSAPERALTRAPGDDGQPRFSPDGRRLAFVSDRGKTDQIWFMPVDGGEPIQATSGEPVGTFAWTADSNGFVFTAAEPLSETEKKRREAGDDAFVYGDDWRRRALWQVSLQGRPVRLTDGSMHVTEVFDVSPDGKSVAFIAQPTPEADAAEEATVRVLDRAAKTVIEVPDSRRATAVAWAGGKESGTLLFARPFDGAGWSRTDLYAWRAGQAQARDLSASIDRDIEAIVRSIDGVTEASWSRGAVSEVAAVTAEGLASPWTPLFPVAFSTRLRDGRIFVRLDRPHEVWRLDRRGQAARPITRLNSARTQSVDLPTLETFRWKSGAWEVEGVLTVPAAAAGPRGGPYPLLVRPHGGPRAHSLMEFGPHDAYFASLGYLVLEPNFRGSTGYGDRFAKGNGGDWGAGPFADVMAGVDALIASGRADPQRLYLFGWSYGGIMANWAATHSDRFRAIVSGAGVADLRMQYILSDARRWRFDYFGGSPFEPQHLPVYWANSPVTAVGKVKSPVLFLQGEEDRRCPLPQALMMHRAILDNGGDSTLVLYPREGHGFREPEHLLDRTRRIAAFFAAHGGLPVPDEPQAGREGGTR